MDHVSAARAHLESVQEGAFSASISEVLARGGVLHAEPECFLLGYRVTGEEHVFHVVYAHAGMLALKRVLGGLDIDTVEWRREFTGRAQYGTRRRPLADLYRHETFGLNR